MIDISEIRNVIRKRIYDSGIIDTDCFAWENVEFDQTGKDLWIAENYFPASGGFQSSKYREMEEGILQFTIFTPINSATRDVVANDAAKSIGDLFTTPEVIEGDTTKASIIVSKSKQGVYDKSSYVSVIDINYKCYSA